MVCLEDYPQQTNNALDCLRKGWEILSLVTKGPLRGRGRSTATTRATVVQKNEETASISGRSHLRFRRVVL